MQYSEFVVRAKCRDLGLDVDEAGLAAAKELADKIGLSQNQFDTVVSLHAVRVRHMFAPRNYGWKARLGFAVHFVFNPKRW